MLTTDHTCAAPEDGAEPGEQPDKRPNRSATKTGSKRPRNYPKRQKGEMVKEEIGARENQSNTLHVVFHFPTAGTTIATAAAAGTAAARRIQ